ncbi:hypothetical protein TYRP_009819 [Tyrophagus putrescentiae]|nr:hypothetical protein TYRP_009819 [Tyrophagus putrescentiae]
MLLWPLAVGPLCTAVVLAGAALRWSSLSARELWAKLSQLTKTYLFAIYLSLVVLCTILPLSADVISWGSGLDEQQRLALAGIIIIVLLMLIVVVILKQPSGTVRAGGTVNLSFAQLDEMQFSVWEKRLKFALSREKLLVAIESKLSDSDERNMTAYQLIVSSVPATSGWKYPDY